MDVKNCTGCGACENICPHNAICLKSNEEGFLYPEVDEERCIDCFLCNKVCQIENKTEIEKFSKKYYALINKNEKHLKVSSSGGAFLAIAKYVLEKDGVVVGCGFDGELKAVHILTYTLDECIRRLCGSKYVQSEIQESYKKIKEELSKRKIVLFVGTPCQVEGLYLFLKNKPENLITIDLICHGVSSPLLWKKHKEYLERKINQKINKYRFRGKENIGWALYYYYYYGAKNNCKKGPAILDRYYTDFLKGINYRESCYSCKFANLNRCGDITIGDFWGAEKFIKNIDIHKGVSLIIINSLKGNEIIKAISSGIKLREVKETEAIQDNQNLIRPTSRSEERNTYYEKAFNNFELWEKEYTNTLTYKINILKNFVPVSLKKILRRLING
ncbi:Coenzyme F420 hydrogenase/dehydrogenase, beta subunit C-terminal domain [Fusobacterium sp.]|uniref:Coenzyme F420 hydrogenase/dehydrogenase, beta subunit C-terminal domain n=1 Tax=Fusobacterium sp. TaxID=68766 RepID=UPI002A751C3F|nr:Coenzyme F420 hydrogenase/dehydrogenase, beta subunit C-terminal domain [Fusobacterium sp.]